MKISATLEEFLQGKPLRYKGADFRVTEATYRVGDGVYLERKGEDVGKAAVSDDKSAARLYHNLTRSKQ